MHPDNAQSCCAPYVVQAWGDPVHVDGPHPCVPQVSSPAQSCGVPLHAPGTIVQPFAVQSRTFSSAHV